MSVQDNSTNVEVGEVNDTSVEKNELEKDLDYNTDDLEECEKDDTNIEHYHIMNPDLEDPIYCRTSYNGGTYIHYSMKYTTNVDDVKRYHALCGADCHHRVTVMQKSKYLKCKSCMNLFKQLQSTLHSEIKKTEKENIKQLKRNLTD